MVYAESRLFGWNRRRHRGGTGMSVRTGHMFAVIQHLFARRSLFAQRARHGVYGVAESGIIGLRAGAEGLLGDRQRCFLVVARGLFAGQIGLDGSEVGLDGCGVEAGGGERGGVVADEGDEVVEFTMQQVWVTMMANRLLQLHRVLKPTG